MQPLYRLWQFLVSLRALCRPPDDSVARSVLSPAEFTVFSRMARYDRAHALRVFRYLQQRGVTDRLLLTAALLHDLAKSAGPERIPFLYRAPVVLGHRWPRLWDWLSRERPRGHPLRPFYLHATHEERGAAMASEAGVSPEAAALIATHHNRRAMGIAALLREADERS